jgi:hypothetical protein
MSRLLNDGLITYLGYKLRKHIAKALQARSQAVRTALDRYNTAAWNLVPPRPALQWKDVVEYAFLADFDLLRDTRQDIRSRVWATPAGRLAMDLYFKTQRAREEIERLNVEIPRVATYIRNEDRFLREQVAEIRKTDPALAHQVEIHRMERGRFNSYHISRLREIRKLRGFTGSICLGESSEGPSKGERPSHSEGDGGEEEEEDRSDEVRQYQEEDEDQEDQEEVGDALYHIARIVDDN